MGLVAGLAWGIWAASLEGFQTSGCPLHLGGLTTPAYIGLYALILNFAGSIVANLAIRVLGMANREDATAAADYFG